LPLAKRGDRVIEEVKEIREVLNGIGPPAGILKSIEASSAQLEEGSVR
jgi:hypothetical protein